MQETVTQLVKCRNSPLKSNLVGKKKKNYKCHMFQDHGTTFN